MNLRAKLTAEPYARLVLGAWWAAGAVGLYFMVLEKGHVVPLAWTAACIVFPFLWNAQQHALRLGTLTLMTGLGLFSLIAMVSIVNDGTWDIHDKVAFAVAALTLLANSITLVAVWRGRKQRTTLASAPMNRPPLGANESQIAGLGGSQPTRNQGSEESGAGIASQSAKAPQTLPKIFISYRRDDSQATTDRVFEHLASEFPRENLFRDIDSIPKGRDFREWIERSVTGCDVLLAIIGPQWLTVADESGNRRLQNPADFVRLEIEAALRRDVPVIPVLLSKAQMPKPEDLPESMRELSFRNGALVRHDPDFANDVCRLIADLRAVTAPP